jgi:predicted RNA binding protein YcfA (HicA-like mRNA interferase family)
MTRRKKHHGGKKLGPEKPERIIAAFKKAGYVLTRQSGSHVIMTHPNNPLPLTIPMHKGQEVQPEIISNLLRIARLSREEFFKLL